MIIHNVTQCEAEWFELRAGIPTASEASKLVTGTGKASTSIKDYAYQLAAELYASKPLDRWEGNEWTERGKDLELEAMIEYERIKDVWTEAVGFCTVDSGNYGCSPDRLIDDGMVEVKCLIAKNHVKNLVYYNKHKLAPPDYIPQTQMQLLVCEKEWCDLVFYHPDLPMFIIRQEKLQGVHEMLIAQLRKCIEMRDEAFEVIREQQ